MFRKKKIEEYDIRTVDGMFHVKIGNMYSATGCCGMKKDEPVIGKLTEVTITQDDAILEDERGIPCLVNLKTLRPEGLTDKQSKLLSFVKKMHGKQMRKYSGKPYWTHALAVANIIMRFIYENDEFLVETALCHDLFEDTDCTGKLLLDELLRIGYTTWGAMMVTSDVFLLTDEYTSEKYPTLNRATRKQKEVGRAFNMTSRAQTVKYADLIHNTQDIVKNDKKFAKVYLLEKLMLLNEMRLGDIRLLVECCYTARKALEEIWEWKESK